MTSKTSRLAVLVTIIGLLLPRLALAAGDVFDQFYRYVEVKNKIIEPHLPGETVDHFTGTLRIVQEDLSLPGRAGLDLRIVRTYSSKIWGRSDLLDLEPLLADKDRSPVGFGWTMHMGRIRNPNASGQQLGCGGGDYPIYEAADGSARTFYPLAASSTNFISRDWWKFTKNCSLTGGGTGVCITDTAGERLEFAQSSQYFLGTTLVLVFPLTAIVDVFGNAIEVTYLSSPAAGLVNVITDSLNRTVKFNYTACGGGLSTQCLQSITASGVGGSRTVSYGYTTLNGPSSAGHVQLSSPGRAFLTTVTPPAGPGYGYEYGFAKPVAQNQYALTKLSYPPGGSTSYAYDTRSFFTGRESVPMAVVTGRTTSGRALPTATWTYDYLSPIYSDVQTTTVTRPDTKQDVHEFYGFGYAAKANATGSVWIVGLQGRISRASGAEVESLTWDKGTAVTQANYSSPFYGNSACPNWTWDTVVQSPILTKRVLTRDGSRYEVAFTGHDKYGQPATATEIGEAQRSSGKPRRVTTYTYNYDTTSNQVVGRVNSERVCQGTSTTDCYLNTRTFNGPSGRMDTETLRGVGSRFGYWTDGNLKNVTNALNQTLTLDGYAMGYGLPTSLDFNGAFSISRTAYWDGRLKSETNGHGDATSYIYDAAGRIKTVTPPGNNDITSYDYSTMGDFYTVSRGSGSTLYSSTTTLDGLGRVVQTSDSLMETETKEYDSLGRLIFKSYPFKLGSSEVGEKVELDPLGRPAATSRRFVATHHRSLVGDCSDLASCRLAVAYQADHCRSATSERGAGDSTTTTSCFESFGDIGEERFVKIIDAKGKDWRYTYDVVGGLTQFTAPMAAGNRSFTFVPGTFFPKTEASGPRGTSTILSHNAAGQPLTQRDSRAIVTTFTYADLLARPTHTQYGAGSPDDVTRTYDKDTLRTLSSTNGGAYTYGYDELNRVTSQSWIFGGKTYATSYEFDQTGCLKKVTYPTGAVLKLTCDRKGRTESVSVVSPTLTELIADSVQYHPGGRPASMTFGNGKSVATVLEYGRVKSITTAGVLGLTYTYDGDDNVKSITDAVVPSNSVLSIGYDKLDRLLSATTAAGKTSFLYDDLGNRTLKSLPGGITTTYDYDPATNRLRTSNGASAPPPMTLAWDSAGTLQSSSDGATYKYDGDGRRVAKQATSAGIDVVYHYDVGGHLLAETLPNGTKIREYFYVADQLVAVDGCVSGFSTACNEREWYHTDVLGTVVARTDRTGLIKARLVYHPWGETPAGTSGTRLFNGRTLDGGTGFYDFGARPYSPELGRFLSADSVWALKEDPQSANLYAYTLNNPYKFSDPTGRLPFLVVTAGIGAVIGGGIAAYATYDSKTGFNWAAIAVGTGAGAVAGLTLGYGVAVAATGTGTASVGAVFSAGGAVANKAIELAPAIRISSVLPEIGRQAPQAVSQVTRNPAVVTWATRVTERMITGGKAHNFPTSFDPLIMRTGQIVEQANGYVQFNLAGGLNTHVGVYQIGGFFTQAGNFMVTHRTFIGQ